MNCRDYTDLNPSTNPLAALYLYGRGVLTNWEAIRFVGQDAFAWFSSAGIRFGLDWTPAERLEWIDLMAVEAAVEWRPEPNWQPSVNRTSTGPQRAQELPEEDPEPTHPPCGLCGERTTEDDQAEMFDPKSEPGPDGVHPAVICHPECGLARGLEVA